MAATTYPWEARSQQMPEDTVLIPPMPCAKTITGYAGSCKDINDDMYPRKRGAPSNAGALGSAAQREREGGGFNTFGSMCGPLNLPAKTSIAFELNPGTMALIKSKVVFVYLTCGIHFVY